MTVTYIDHMGSDETVARSAWVSTQKDAREATSEAAERLIRFLLSQRPCHASPFGHPHLTVMVTAPIFVAREWMRHRAQTFSEVSTRYSDMAGETYLPPIEDFRAQVGRPGEYQMQSMDAMPAMEARTVMQHGYDAGTETYLELLDMGLAREVARNVLPLGTMTRFYATASLRNWLAFLVLRDHPSALLEIQREARAVGEILTERFPTTMAVWESEGRPSL